MKLLILTPIAERDVHFYLASIDAIKKEDNNTQFLFLSFYQPLNNYIESKGYKVLDPYKLFDKHLPESWTAEWAQKKFKTPDLGELIVHEQLTFGITSSHECIAKFIHFTFACDLLLTEVEQLYPQAKEKHFLQELAGFLGPLALFYVGQSRGWKSWMTEPSFFKGRIHFVKNSLYLNIPEGIASEHSTKEVEKYLESAFKNKIVVAAVKDSHHYKDMGVGKIFNFSNFKKLFKKIIYKYFFRQKQEFEHIGNHVIRYLKMMLNRRKNEKNYTHLLDLPAGFKFYYFPFHVQLDFSLTIRSPRWLDQLSLIEKVLELLPKDVVLISKEHPASIGCLDQKRLEKLLAHPQFRILHPMINSHDVLDKTTAVVTINSKVGAEAFSKGIPVITFGKAFYTERGIVPHFEDWQKLSEWLKNPTYPANSKAWKDFLGKVWDDSYPTELYDLSSNNIEKFAQAINEKILQ